MLIDLALLYTLGLAGWQLAKRLNVPVAPLLGSLLFVGILKIIGLNLPTTPDFFAPILQILLGVMVGSRFTQDTISQLKELILPGILIITWVLLVVFLLGYLLAYVTYLDPFTAILSSSMGGLPEMTVIAIAVEADLGVILLIQLSRLILTFLLFPLFIKRKIEPIECEEEEEGGHEGEEDTSHENPGFFKVLSILFLGSLGGLLFLMLGVPAGGMVGSMLFIITAALLGLTTFRFPPSLLNLLLIGVGILAADTISPSTFTTLSSLEFLTPFSLSLIITFSSSFLVAHLIKRLTGWDELTSFLAAAPAGLTTMTLLAIQYNRDPLRISMLHLCRLLSLKILVPLFFMFFI